VAAIRAMINLLVAAIAIALLLTYAAPHVIKRVRIRRLRETCRRDRALVLTYDDGPSPNLTPALLNLLGHRDATANFFVLGQRIRGNEQIIDRMVADGHEIGCHGQDHVNAWKASPWRVASDVQRGFESLRRWHGACGLFRPPYGKLSLPAWWVARRRGARLGWWTIDSGDTHMQLPKPQSVADALARAGGGVVLMHDFDRGPERAQFVLQTTELLLETARREGLTVYRYSDLCAGQANVAIPSPAPSR
jgi:peptidoglycan/xylan/chitin deacetylase (PgdA/CDA1 family)